MWQGERDLFPLIEKLAGWREGALDWFSLCYSTPSHHLEIAGGRGCESLASGKLKLSRLADLPPLL